MSNYAVGRDFSSYQRPVTAADLAGLSFAGCRVSDWGGPDGLTMGTDPDFAHNWAAFEAAGLARIAYWYFQPLVDPVAQARYLVDAVNIEGLKPGDILVCDSELLTPNVDAATYAFCNEADHLSGPQAITMVYTDQNVGRHLVSCTRWPLWLAWPSAAPPGIGQCDPWPDWVFWQDGIVRGVDDDKFHGTPAQLRAWIQARITPHSGKDDDPMFIDLSAAGAQAHVPVWPLAGSAGLSVPWRNATLVLAGQDGAVVEAWVHYQDGRTETGTYVLSAGAQTLVSPGSLKGVATVHLQRADTPAVGRPVPAASAVLSRW